MGGLEEEWWVFGFGDEVRLRVGASWRQGLVEIGAGDVMQVRLVAGCGLCKIRGKHPSLGFLVIFT